MSYIYAFASPAPTKSSEILSVLDDVIYQFMEQEAKENKLNALYV